MARASSVLIANQPCWLVFMKPEVMGQGEETWLEMLFVLARGVFNC